MSESLEPIFKFIETHQLDIVAETLTSLKFVLNIDVKEIDDSDIIDLQKFDNVTFSFKYREQISSAQSIEQFKELFGNSSNYLKVDELVTVTISIKKSTLNKNEKFENFYFFSSYLHFGEKFGNVYKTFEWKKDSKKLYIFCLDMDAHMEYLNDFIHVLPFANFANTHEENIRTEAIKKFNVFKENNENRTISDMFNYPLTWIDNRGKAPLFFLNHTVNIFFESISNDISNDNKVLIKGYKNIYFEKVLVTEIKGNYQECIAYTFKLIDFLIDEDKFYDKLLIIRNNITLYLNTKSSIKDYLEKNKEIYKTITHNFDLYIQNEITVFLEQKNSLLHEFISVSKQLGNMTNDLSNQLRNIGLSLLGTVFIGIVSDIDTELSIPSLNLILLSYSVFFVINLVMTFSHSKQFRDTKLLLKNYTGTIAVNTEDLSYKNLQMEYLQGPSNNFRSLLWGTRIFLLILTIIFINCYLFINFGWATWLIELLKYLLNIA